ncbi:hypothetical protein EVA_18759, partial [gut metagenome]
DDKKQQIYCAYENDNTHSCLLKREF